MSPVLLAAVGVWLVLLGAFAFALCASGGRADDAIERASRARAAQDELATRRGGRAA